jgi:prepilin-type N-terminal cleavage/methylation domain-containing protein
MKGFTLIELMVSLFIIVVGLLGIILANIYTQRTSDGTYEKMVAVQDAHRVLEMMRSASKTGTFPANVTSAFPQGAAVAGFTNLSTERVTVTYSDALGDPLDVTVTTSWRERGMRNTSTQLRTLLTQRQ